MPVNVPCPNCGTSLRIPDTALGKRSQTRTRNRHESKKTFEITAGDYFLWWLPALGCLLGIAALIGFDVYYLFYLEKDVDPDSFLLWKGIKFWVVAISVAAMWPQARYAFKRLILNTHPPEQEKKK